MPLGARKRSERFDSIIRPHVKPLYQAAYRLVRNRSDAEDLVQEVLVKAYKRLTEIERMENLRAWLLRVLYHQFVDLTRKHGRSPQTVSDDGLLAAQPDESQDPAELTAQRSTAAELGKAMAGLTADQRALLDLHIVQGYTLQELVAVFDAPLGTLKSRVHRIKVSLKKELLNATLSPN